MVNQKKSTIGVRDFTNNFSRGVVKGKTVLRDGRKIVVAGSRPAFTKKNPEHISFTMAAFNKLKNAKLEKVVVVPVKTYPNNVQKYFQRPSLLTFYDYCAFKLGKKKRLHEAISATDILYCEKLLKKHPAISIVKWYDKTRGAITEIGEKIGFGRTFTLTINDRQHLIGSDFGNFIVFGVDKKGIIKVGIVDV